MPLQVLATEMKQKIGQIRRLIKVISIMWELTDKLNFFQVWKVGKDKPAVFVVNQSLLCVTSPSNNVSYISSLKPDRNLLFLQRR